MVSYTVAVIGTGPDPETPVSGESYAMAYRHARAYQKLDSCTLVACADIVRPRAEAFAVEYGIAEKNVYEDYEAMLAEAEPDIVSVCVPPALHAELVIGCAKGGVDAIHCEKPMANTWENSQRMVQECDRRNIQLTFNHQHRFGTPIRRTKELLDSGEIGDLRRVEYGWGDFYDNGTHAIDMINFLNDDRSATWVLGALDYREENIRYGVETENQMLALWEYSNGVYGLASTGHGAGLVDCTRLVGSDGVIELAFGHRERPPVRLRRAGETEWNDVGVDSLYEDDAIDRAIADIVAARAEGRTSTLSAQHALNATEIIFAGYESVRRRGRVDLPLEIEDHPLATMVETGALQPEPTSDSDDESPSTRS